MGEHLDNDHKRISLTVSPRKSKNVNLESKGSLNRFHAQTLLFYYIFYPEAVVQRCSVKKVFLEVSQNSQENTCARVSFLIKLQA